MRTSDMDSRSSGPCGGRCALPTGYQHNAPPIRDHGRQYPPLNRSAVINFSLTVVVVQVDTHFDGIILVEWRVLSSRVLR